MAPRCQQRTHRVIENLDCERGVPDGCPEMLSRHSSSSSVHCDDIKAADRSGRRLSELVDQVSPCGDSGVDPRFLAVVYTRT